MLYFEVNMVIENIHLLQERFFPGVLHLRVASLENLILSLRVLFGVINASFIFAGLGIFLCIFFRRLDSDHISP